MRKRWHLFRVKRLSITKTAEFFKIVLIPPINLSECLYIKDSFEIHPSLHPSHAQTPLYKGVSKDLVRGERFFAKVLKMTDMKEKVLTYKDNP